MINESQKIVFEIAFENLKNAAPRLGVVSGAALGLHKDRDGNEVENKYSLWAKEADKMGRELNESIRLFQIIYDEINLKR